jgi:hypothetical protein
MISVQTVEKTCLKYNYLYSLLQIVSFVLLGRSHETFYIHRSKISLQKQRERTHFPICYTVRRQASCFRGLIVLITCGEEYQLQSSSLCKCFQTPVACFLYRRSQCVPQHFVVTHLTVICHNNSTFVSRLVWCASFTSTPQIVSTQLSDQQKLAQKLETPLDNTTPLPPSHSSHHVPVSCAHDCFYNNSFTIIAY